jgi:quercetin dioxygenase-like cupin family protein
MASFEEDRVKNREFRFRRGGLAALAAIVGLFLWAPATTFAESDAYAAAVTVKPIIVTSVTGNGMPIDYPDTDREEVTAAEVILNPGAETGWHMHAGPVYAYVLAGRLGVDYADGTGKIFATGEAVIEVVNTPHNGRALGSEQVRLIVFYLGVKGKPNSEKLPAPER